ncbi:MAG: ATP-dependent helicase [Burkholderiaceae bacterium]
MSLPWAGTFHSVAARMLRELAPELGLNPGFTVLDRGDALDLLGALREHYLGRSRQRRIASAATMLSVMSDCVNTGEPLAGVLRDRYPWCVRDQALMTELFAEFAQTKADQALLDFDDLLQWLVTALQVPALALAWQQRFDAIIVDESQDCNPLQWQMLRALAPQGRGVFLVGDAAQCIYGFRGARIEDLDAYVGDLGARTLSLSRNYRSRQPVLDLANALLADARPAIGVQLQAADALGGSRPRLVSVHDEAAQTDYVIAQVLAEREAGVRLQDQAVLFRSAHHSDMLELALTRAGIPFVKHGGLKFIDAAHVRDVLACARWATNPVNRLAAMRALQMLPGVGTAHARRLLAMAAGHGNELFSRIDAAAAPEPAREPLCELLGLLDALSRAARGLREFDALIAWFAPLFAERYEHPATRLADLDMLAGAARRAGSVRAMLTELALDPPQAASDLGDRAHRDDDMLVLSTVHSAKGQEWRNVFLLQVSDGNFPNEYATGNRRALAEERRLLYVAMTRARRQLHLIEPRCYHVTAQPRLGARHVSGARSRFLSDAVLARLDHHHWPEAAASTHDAAGSDPHAAGSAAMIGTLGADPGGPPVAAAAPDPHGVARKMRERWQGRSRPEAERGPDVSMNSTVLASGAATSDW